MKNLREGKKTGRREKAEGDSEKRKGNESEMDEEN